MASLTLVRQIKAQPSAVFDFLITANGISQWWGPDAGPVLSSVSDPRVGGHFQLHFRTLNGTECKVSGEFCEVTSPKRVLMTWQWAGDMEASRIEIVLRPTPEGTELTFIHTDLPDENTARGHEKGWKGSLDKLEALFPR